VVELGIGKNVLFLGSRRDVPDIIGLVDLTVLPSLQEGFGVVLIESLAQAKPVVATCVGGIPEIVRDGETGILVPSKDAEALERGIRHVLEHPDVAKRLGACGHELVRQKYSQSGLATATEKLYGTLLEPGELSRAAT
jgi:glycosyltransferase involved in cell wall biosynthesis